MDSLCLQPLFLRIIYLSGKILNVLRFVVPIALIIKISIDIYKHIINPDDKDGLNNVKTKIIAAIIIFLTPTLVTVVFNFIEKTLVNYKYSDLTVCREFANMKHIEAIENEMEEIEKRMADDKKISNLNAYQRRVEAIREYVAAKDTDNTNNNSNGDNNGNNNSYSGIVNPGEMKALTYSNWNYYFYKPNNENNKKSLVVFLHGSGEKGSNISLLERYGFAKYIKKNGANYDTYILMPQLSGGESNWSSSKIMSLINKVVSENNIDKSRISIVGFSLGTVPIPNLLKENPNYFSAVVLIALCGGNSSVNYFKNTPTRLYHGGADSSGCSPSNAKSFANSLKKINNNVDIVVYDGKPHNVVDTVLKDGSVINWMTSQRR